MRISDHDLAPVDTITAQATPPGRGGVAVIRVSGPLVKSIMQSVLGIELVPRQASYLAFQDHDGSVLDEGIALFFEQPHSFTGEDVLELQGHGGPVVVDLILQRIMTLGARIARPGEFSERAFLNGKMDLAQAEAVADLIDASSQQAAKLAVRSLQGDFSQAIHHLNEKIIQLRLYVEAAIDFTDEDIDFLSSDHLAQRLQAIEHDLASIELHARQGSFLREGITAVIAGEPNVGKSSLLNQLSGKELAIVTDIPGTTRDVLRDVILMDDMPMHIIDTAGLRESDDVVEQEGIRRARREMENADVILYLFDAAQHTELAKTKLNKLSDQHVIVIRNKIDLLQEAPSIHQEEGYTVVSLSAKTGVGIDLLKQQIKKEIGFDQSTEGLYLARRRHLDALARAKAHFNEACCQLAQHRSTELAAEELRLAHRAVSEITGEFTPDDLLGRIFSTFCIGK